MKLSREKATYPYRKQVWRNRDAEGKFANDIIAMAAETEQHGEPLLKAVMRAGQLLEPPPTLREIQQHARRQLAALPTQYKTIRDAKSYPVRFSDHLFEQRMQLMKQLEQS